MNNLRNIETFFWASTLGSFRAAAEKLNTTQPTVSQRISLLEEELSVRLFDRAPQGVVLTAKGQEMLAYAERLLQLRREMLQAAHEEQAMSGTLRIGVAETIVQTWLPSLLERIHAAYPSLVLEIEVDTSLVLREHLLSRQINLALLIGPILDARVENLPLCRYPLDWVASPSLGLSEEPLTLQQVAKLPIITYPSTSSPHLMVRDMLTRAGVASPRMYGCASLSMIVRMALDGIGVSVMTPVFLDKELASGALRRVQVMADPLPELSFSATWLSGPESYMAKVIAQLAQSIAARETHQNTPEV